MIILKFLFWFIIAILIFVVILVVNLLLRFTDVLHVLFGGKPRTRGNTHFYFNRNPFQQPRDNPSGSRDDTRQPSISGKPTRPKSRTVDDDEEYAEFEEIH